MKRCEHNDYPTSCPFCRIAALEAELARVTTERDEWASKWKEMRRMLAEVKYPGMTNIVKVMDGDAALAKGEKA